MISNVFFASRKIRKKSLLDSCSELFSLGGFSSLIKKGDLVAVKVHFGERGNTAFVSPMFIRRIVDEVKKNGGKPFLTDANTLYVGGRSNAVDHLQTALQHGFTYSTVSAPLIIADGLSGRDYVSVKIDGKHFPEVKIASTTYQADVLLVCSHFKGHEMTGFGGALKNVGMGLGARSAKQMIHSDVLPQVDIDKCTGCAECLSWCPAEAITLVRLRRSKKRAKIDSKKCLGCGECVVTCRYGAIAINWEENPAAVQEKIAEHVLGVLKNKGKKVGFFNFLLNVASDCDCWTWNDLAIVPDIGILASRDPVAIDQASLDLVNQTQGIEGSLLSNPNVKNKFADLHPSVDPTVQLAYAEKLGLGTRKYNLVEAG